MLTSLPRRRSEPKRTAAVAFQPLPSFTFAFQSIVHVPRQTVVAYEALVRGARGEGASRVMGGVQEADLPRFDEHCRTTAMRLASKLGLACDLNLNLVSQGFHADRDCLASTLDAAIEFNLFPERLVVEITEGEVLEGQERFTELMEVYRGLGMRLAIDNFGSVYGGLNLLAGLQPDQVKLDKELTRSIITRPDRQAIVRGVLQVCRDLGIELVAEGVESADQFHWLCDAGVELFQGYLFGRPGFELLPAVQIPQLA